MFVKNIYLTNCKCSTLHVISLFSQILLLAIVLYPLFLLPDTPPLLYSTLQLMLHIVHFNTVCLLKSANEYWFWSTPGDSSFVICHARFHQPLHNGLVEKHNKIQLIQRQTIYHNMTHFKWWSSRIDRVKSIALFKSSYEKKKKKHFFWLFNVH